MKEVWNHITNMGELNGNLHADDPNIKLKALSSHLKYMFLGEHRIKPVIISSSLFKEEEMRLIWVLRVKQEVIGWALSDFKGINPSYCMHKIHMEQDYKPIV